MRLLNGYAGFIFLVTLLTGCAGRYIDGRAPTIKETAEFDEGTRITETKIDSQRNKRLSSKVEITKVISSGTSVPQVPAEPPVSLKIASELRGKFIIAEASAATLLVKNQNTKPSLSSSLFEEAIALNKLRGCLKAKCKAPPHVIENTTLRNGTATIPFFPSISPSYAAETISKALSIEGIQCVRANF